MVFSHGTWMQIPEFMPALVRHLVEHAKVWWCTEWEDSANDDLPAALRIAPLPVLRQPTPGIPELRMPVLVPSMLPAELRPVGDERQT